VCVLIGGGADNPYLAAQRFLDQEDLPQYFLEECAAHLIQNLPASEFMAPGINVDPLTQSTTYKV
jgi:hypothetical protein